MPKNWKIAPKISEDLIEQLIFNRGLKGKKEIEKFFNPKLEDYQQDLQIPGIEEAKRRILKAVEDKELIIVYGDYDVDGVSATAVLYHVLTLMGAKVLPYIPHREKEGYGLSLIGLDLAKEKGAKLVITADHGIVAIEQAKYAKKLNLDLIITDHHQPSDKKPEALTIIHSTKMCGAGVTWCLARSLVDQNEAEELLDLVALGTICDLVPLTEINRALVWSGLEKLNRTKRVGLLALIREARLKAGSLQAYHVGHVLGPRLNAIGRLEHAIDALRLLCTRDVLKAKQLSMRLCEANDQKKGLTAEAISEAKEIITQDNIVNLGKRKILVLYSKKWIPGIIGLIAARIAEEYNLPTVVISQGEDYSKGSARSVRGLDIVETIRKCSDLLKDIGGHPKAAGFTIESSKIEEFEQRLAQILDPVTIEINGELLVEAVVDPKEVTFKLVEEINKFEPFGAENPQPVLASFNVYATDIKTVGEGKHLKFKTDGVETIAFSFGNFAKILKEGQLLNVAYYPEINEFNGNRRLQLKVLDIQLA